MFSLVLKSTFNKTLPNAVIISNRTRSNSYFKEQMVRGRVLTCVFRLTTDKVAGRFSKKIVFLSTAIPSAVICYTTPS